MASLQDGLFLVTNSLDLVRDYPLAVLTPNINEYKRLVQKVLNCEVNEEEGSKQLLALAKGYVINGHPSDVVHSSNKVSFWHIYVNYVLNFSIVKQEYNK